MSKYGYITKYVNREYFIATKCGRLKFGTLSEYRNQENGPENRFTDTAEGISDLNVPCDGNTKNLSFVLAGMGVENVSVIGNPKQNHMIASIKNVIDANVFCSSVGEYNHGHHHVIREKGNNTLTHYVTFDLSKFIYACERLCKCMKAYSLTVNPVKYQSRDEVILPKDLSMNDPFSDPNFELNIFKKILFHKPKEFSYENENRVVILPKQPSQGEDISPIYTKKFSTYISTHFRNAVVSSGKYSA